MPPLSVRRMEWNKLVCLKLNLVLNLDKLFFLSIELCTARNPNYTLMYSVQVISPFKSIISLMVMLEKISAMYSLWFSVVVLPSSPK